MYYEVQGQAVLGFSAGGHTAIALARGRPAAVRRLIAASTFASRDAVPDEFWDAMAKATLDDMPETYKAADRRLNPQPGHLERLFELDKQRILDRPLPAAVPRRVADPTVTIAQGRKKGSDDAPPGASSDPAAGSFIRSGSSLPSAGRLQLDGGIRADDGR